MKKRADELRDVLEEEILTGKLRPGTRLEEIALAERFGVSRTPIREALFQLSAAGLIESRSRRMTVVAEIGPRRLLEMFDVMAEYEALAARLAARRARPEEMDAILAAHEACGDAVSNVDEYYYCNETFHELIRKASHNEFLILQADSLQKRLKPYRRLQLRARERIQNSYAEHDRIVKAIAGGLPDEAADAMRAHIVIQGERFNDLLVSLEREEV